MNNKSEKDSNDTKKTHFKKYMKMKKVVLNY